MLTYGRLFRFLKNILSVVTHPNGLGLLFLTILILFHDNLKNVLNSITQNHDTVYLAIGILSAQENFIQREAARATWLKNLTGENSNVKALFIVGKTACKIPPEYRLSVFGCEKWNINVSGLQEHFFTTSEAGGDIIPCSTSLRRIIHQGFTFQVNYPVVVTKLGIHSRLLFENVPTRVALMDIQSKEIVVQGTVSVNLTTSVNGYIYTDVETILLPKNYEGLLVVEGYLKSEECLNVAWNDGGGVITFKRIYSNSHLDSQLYSSKFSTAASIGFFTPDIANLTKIANDEDLVKRKWLQELEKSNNRLQAEVDKKKDIVIVNVTDTYRSLPLKLLKFYIWLDSHYKYSFLLKTDDDCIVDINSLLTKLGGSQFDSSRPWIWSRFRKDWPVNYIGKWADYDYSSSFYPSFPCGAAYVMSYPTVHWISSNAEHLYSYQGEDVSLGIWLSAIKPVFIEDGNFECDDRCKTESYNRAQLSINQVHKAWSNFKTCNSLCTCDSISL